MVFSTENLSLEIDEQEILKEINIGFKKHQFNAIIGPNGCGKSTLIKLFAKITKPTQGKVLFFDENITNIKKKDFAKKVAFFFQFNDSPSEITVEQMVSYGRSAHKSIYKNLNRDDLKIINDCLEKCDLIELKNRSFASLSGGERQRVYLAMTFAQQPEIIILDEPTNHLDIKYQFQLLSLIHKVMIENNLTIICILHDLNQVLKYADNTLILSKGKVYANGKTSKIITTKSVKEVFQIDSIIHTDGNGYHIDFII